MFEGYTMNQLLDLRSLCADTIELADDVHKRADTLLLLECIDEELAIREHKQSFRMRTTRVTTISAEYQRRM